ncbi:hypothetical protein VTK73DRAFT_3762 [Phialemonium thermophilum]|uniref:Uncharacterized protein n=1 Tax=Phialemonium thermophilum TaxID=223376 RepID=A0ABR3WX14_9PEZI
MITGRQGSFPLPEETCTRPPRRESWDDGFTALPTTGYMKKYSHSKQGSKACPIRRNLLHSKETNSKRRDFLRNERSVPRNNAPQGSAQ